MARALSHLHSLIRGSVGGLTYFSNQFHQICMRQRTAPVQPNTPWQSGIRTAFNVAEAAWEALTSQQRDDWNDYAATCVYPGPAGPYSVPGRQLMVGTLALAYYNLGIKPGEFYALTTAPVIAGWYNPGAVIAVDYTGTTQGIAVQVVIPAPSGAAIFIDVSIAFNHTRNRYKGPWISSAKHIAFLLLGLNTINIDRPEGTAGKIIFSRTRLITAQTIEPNAIPHRLAFPVILRHTCLTVANGNNGEKPAKTKSRAKKKPA